MRWHAWALGAAMALALSASASAAPARRVVQTKAGAVRGVPQYGAEAFLGIPFAKPPVGALRWKPPAPPSPWKGVRDGSRFGTNCYQGPPTRFGPYTPEFLIELPVSEDCLYLNVWRPAKPVGKLPVLVFIHGGGFGGGSGSIPIYNGARLATKGAVVVTINYRVGAFGFMAHPQLTAESPRRTSGNYGVLDAIAALKWVKANAAAFGGDPARVTVSGQSAGAMLINDLLLSPDAKGLFQGAITESGTAANVPSPPLKEAEAQGASLAAKLGAKTLADLRALPAEAIAKAAGGGPPAPGQPRPPAFAPNVDGVVITANPIQGGAAVSVRVPLVAGYNSDEGGLGGIARDVTPAQFDAAVRQRYGAFADRLLAVYPHATDAEAAQSTQLLGRDQTMAALAVWAEARTNSSGAPIYLYRFEHPYPGPEADRYGTFHTAEVPYIFGVLDQQGRPFTAADHRVSDQLQAYWLAFMKRGAPAGPGPAWPAVRPGAPQVMQLGDRVGPVGAVSTPERMAVFRALIAAQGSPRLL